MRMHTFVVNVMASTFALGAIIAPSLAAAQWHGGVGHGGGAHGTTGFRGGGHGGGFRVGGGGLHGQGYYPRGAYRGGGYGAGYGLGAGVAGLAAGALIGGAIASQNQGYPVQTYSGYSNPGYVYSDAAAVPNDTADAVAYCQRTYRSYDPSRGSCLGYDASGTLALDGARLGSAAIESAARGATRPTKWAASRPPLTGTG
jgi:hypothetical protein